ncbi:MAG: hypothetical protein Q8807_03970, partial ['Waltheria sp.' little leaf phytoplasma]|nr:hypothetical protein ['Waltheria sp.' little leaf phytoplasma]
MLIRGGRLFVIIGVHLLDGRRRNDGHLHVGVMRINFENITFQYYLDFMNIIRQAVFIKSITDSKYRP